MMTSLKEEDNKAIVVREGNTRTSTDKIDNCMNPNNMEILAGLKEMPLPEDEALKNPKKWFVMRDLKRANAKLPAYKFLAQESIRVYTPMKEKLVLKNGRAIRHYIPVVHGLLFAQDTLEHIEPIVEATATLQFRYLKGKYKEPMVVKDRDMENFIRAGEDYPSIHYYTPDEITPEMLKRKVRVVGGPFDQQEGHLLTRQGSKSKRLLVGIPSLIYKSIEIYDYDYLLLI